MCVKIIDYIKKAGQHLHVVTIGFLKNGFEAQMWAALVVAILTGADSWETGLTEQCLAKV